MKNTTTTAAAIAAIQTITAQAIKAIEAIMAETTTAETTETSTPAETAATESTTTETATTTTTPIIVLDDDDNVITTTETTTEATTTETATTTPEEKAMNDPKSIVVLDDDDNVIAVGKTPTETTGDLPCPIEATAPAETDEAEIKNQISVGDLEKIADEAKEIDLTSIYSILKYALHHEGRNEERDRSPYAPDRNVTADIGHCCRIHLAMFNDEISIILKHKDYSSPLINKTITKHGDCKENENKTLPFINSSVKAEAEIKRFLGIFDDIKDLICKK